MLRKLDKTEGLYQKEVSLSRFGIKTIQGAGFVYT